MPADLIGARMTDDEERHALLAIESRQPVIVPDVWSDDRVNRDHLRKHNVRAVLVVPLVARDCPLSVMFFNYHTAPHAFTEAEVNFVRQLGGTAAIALENARLFDEHKRIEESLREADGRKDEFLALLGHELRNPLGVINTSVQLLDSQSGDILDEVRDIMTRQVAHMARLVDDLLDVSRVTRGQVHLDMEPGDLTALLDETLKEHRTLFDEAGLRLLPQVAAEPLWVLGDQLGLNRQSVTGCKMLANIPSGVEPYGWLSEGRGWGFRPASDKRYRHWHG